MSNPTEHHLEHAEHAQHAAHDPFDRRVAFTMAVIAALLAVVTMLSHRAHNDTLRLQAEGNRLQTESNILHTRASDQWSYFQAKKNRQYLYEANADMLAVLATGPGGTNTEAVKRADDWKSKTEKYKQESREIEEKAREFEREAEEKQKEAMERLEESHAVHHRANRYDWGELGIEMALVLSSVTLLTKRPEYWYLGVVAGLVGAVLAGSGLFLH
jgi:hypothetical protein